MPNSCQNSCLPFASQNDVCFDQKSSHFELSHDIDIQSIYGFDQIIHRQPSSTVLLDHAAIARNFSKRTLCSNISQREEFGFINHVTDQFEPKIYIEKSLASSWEIFKEPPPTAVQNIDQRKSTIFTQWRSQSQNLIIGSQLKTQCATHHSVPCVEPAKEIEKDPSVQEKVNFMLGDEEVNQFPEEEKRIFCCCTVFTWFVRFFDLDLLRDKIYLNIMIGMAMSIFAEINFAILTPFILSDLNFNTDEVAFILLTMAVADLISRFCSPFIADKLNLSIRVSYIISLILLVITRMCM